MKKVLSGNEAIALGVYENGVRFASAYPGTPSTEILENFARYKGVYAEWAPNEKVAVESAIGASMVGARVLAVMKHVGLNVAADPFMELPYSGVSGGFVLVNADDPGMHSSQNEQDNRLYARFAQIPMFEPSDSQEAKDMVTEAYKLSEKYETPVMVRTTTRISHSKGIVEVSEDAAEELNVKGFEKNRLEKVMIPAYARPKHTVILNNIKDLTEYSEISQFNREEIGSYSIGIITSSISYQYVKEVLPGAAILKLGFTYPLPEKKIKEFAAKVKLLFVVEELEPYLEDQIKAMGIKIEGKRYFPRIDEFSPEIVAAGFKKAGVLAEDLPAVIEQPENTNMPRPPLMCPGCSHRGLLYAINRLNGIVHGDIGCYTLSVMPPLESLDTNLCMGASISMAHGTAKAMEVLESKDNRPVFAVIGDSTFFHSGMTSLLNVVYNNSNVNICILDNHTTAMTGAQEHPGTGKTLQLADTRTIDVIDVVRALGCSRVREVDPFDLKATHTALQEEAEYKGPSVIVTKKPCVQLLKGVVHDVFSVDIEKCIGCAMCLKLGCPAIGQGEIIPMKNNQTKRYSVIDTALCAGCSLCEQVCKPGAIRKVQ